MPPYQVTRCHDLVSSFKHKSFTCPYSLRPSPSGTENPSQAMSHLDFAARQTSNSSRDRYYLYDFLAPWAQETKANCPLRRPSRNQSQLEDIRAGHLWPPRPWSGLVVPTSPVRSIQWKGGPGDILALRNEKSRQDPVKQGQVMLTMATSNKGLYISVSQKCHV